LAQTTYRAKDDIQTSNLTSDLNTIINFSMEDNSSLIETGEWGSWGADDCFNGIDYRVKKGDYNSYAKQWYWYVQFRNRYNKPVNFSYAVDEPGTRPEPDHRSRMDASSESDSTGFLLYSGTRIHVRIGYIRFGSYDSGAYATCDK
tara:strand:+ start:1899 stop:2336 length:438 start_codon:yes stop_codon:yes gene_type:complete